MGTKLFTEALGVLPVELLAYQGSMFSVEN